MQIHHENRLLLCAVTCVLTAACTLVGPSTPESTGNPVVGAPPPTATSTADAGSAGSASNPELSVDAGITFPTWDAGGDSTAPPAPAPLPSSSAGGTSRIAINGICCYGGNYFACPNAAACFGGFDVSACIATCNGPEDPCFGACFAKQDSAGPPVGCAADITAPPGVDCALGNIHVGP